MILRIGNFFDRFRYRDFVGGADFTPQVLFLNKNYQRILAAFNKGPVNPWGFLLPMFGNVKAGDPLAVGSLFRLKALNNLLSYNSGTVLINGVPTPMPQGYYGKLDEGPFRFHPIGLLNYHDGLRAKNIKERDENLLNAARALGLRDAEGNEIDYTKLKPGDIKPGMEFTRYGFNIIDDPPGSGKNFRRINEAKYLARGDGGIHFHPTAMGIGHHDTNANYQEQVYYVGDHMWHWPPKIDIPLEGEDLGVGGPRKKPLGNPGVGGPRKK